MKRHKAYFFLLIIIGTLYQSCERDEICIDEITPHLVIRLYDKNNPTELKKISTVAIKIVALDSIITVTAQDSILLPIDLSKSSTQYILTINKDKPEEKSDTITIAYTSEDIFVGRSCGYKTIFNTVSYQLETPEQWIDNIEPISSKIENENNAHVKLFF